MTPSPVRAQRFAPVERIAEGRELAPVALHLHLQRFDLVDAVADEEDLLHPLDLFLGERDEVHQLLDARLDLRQLGG
jgi:hypothetical protein